MGFLLLFVSCKEETKYIKVNEEKLEIEKIQWEETKKIYVVSLQNAIDLLSQIENLGSEHSNSPKIFRELRQEWKKAEPYAAYLNPEVGHRINGPALPIFIEDSESILPPVGLQKIEESIFDGDTSENDFLKEVQITRGMMEHLLEIMGKRELTPDRFFIAIHQQLLRLISFSITGFDTPVISWGISEAAISLESLGQVYNASIREIVRRKNPELDQDFSQSLRSSIKFLKAEDNFLVFDRFTFIRDYFNPMMSNWVRITNNSGWSGPEDEVFNFLAPTFFEEDSFNISFFMPPVNQNITADQIKLGKKLFSDKNLSKNQKISCATCHVPEKAYADGMVSNFDNTGNLLERNTPSLLNVIFQQSFFWDGRSGNIMDQVTAVFRNKKEFNSGVHQLSDKMLTDISYEQLFQNAYGKSSSRYTNIIKALSAYIATLNGFNSKFDRNIRGEEKTYTTQEKLGFNVYMGKALCATCHFIPLTNGTVPPFYKETEREVIGVPETTENLALDRDFGIFWQYELDFQKGMFKTPSLRNTELTSPYMHNGLYSTLEEVIEFYDLGGGSGIGLNLPHQTLPPESLNLTQEEKSALISFIKTLSDFPLNK
ncbi:cytochrome-c peroxidase [Gillisia hiemivivida]|uniref:Cytochrome-c peroxidase n=1 Tax=Gillisia hiemivivida TaxID=291190 RepID=A0A5C6ZSM0_9FLAO|nr:cytochrome c peroxidase [Gillisia hiemivivida]TXD92846.1 cytochrome-c peroxidase [Gillisia hiemivivida]